MRKVLEQRLISLSSLISNNCKNLQISPMSKNLISQIVRSSSSAALNYGEAQSAESKRDFIHKISIVLKELRETHINLRILLESENPENRNDLIKAIDECDQLISIFYATVKTARKNIGN